MYPYIQYNEQETYLLLPTAQVCSLLMLTVKREASTIMPQPWPPLTDMDGLEKRLSASKSYVARVFFPYRVAPSSESFLHQVVHYQRSFIFCVCRITHCPCDLTYVRCCGLTVERIRRFTRCGRNEPLRTRRKAIF